MTTTPTPAEVAGAAAGEVVARKLSRRIRNGALLLAPVDKTLYRANLSASLVGCIYAPVRRAEWPQTGFVCQAGFGCQCPCERAMTKAAQAAALATQAGVENGSEGAYHLQVAHHKHLAGITAARLEREALDRARRYSPEERLDPREDTDSPFFQAI